MELEKQDELLLLLQAFNNNNRIVEKASVPCLQQLKLMFTKLPQFDNSMLLPYELLSKIFEYVVEISDCPIIDLCNMARVCEIWRQIIIKSPTLWTHIDLATIPMTEDGLLIPKKIFRLNPSVINHIKEITLGGILDVCFRSRESLTFVEELIAAPNLETLTFKVMRLEKPPDNVAKSIIQHRNIRKLNLIECTLSDYRWLISFLQNLKSQIEVLNLYMSFDSIPYIFRDSFFPNLRVLDISICSCSHYNTIDVRELAKNMPMLEILRACNVPFQRVNSPVELISKHLRELSIPIKSRDSNRDDKMLATLTFGSEKMTTLDLRGCCTSPHALLAMPSMNVKELHIDVLRIRREHYSSAISKWSHSLEILSLVEIKNLDNIPYEIWGDQDLRGNNGPQINLFREFEPRRDLFRDIATQSEILKSLESDIFPNLRVLDISTKVSLPKYGIDAKKLAKNMPMLEILRACNVSFKRVRDLPEESNLKHLRELSLPIKYRDIYRDDELFATLTNGSEKITTLDLRGCFVSPNALLAMSSLNVKELHIDGPGTKAFQPQDYPSVILKWSHSLEVLSLVEIDSPETIKNCLEALYQQQEPKIKELNLSKSNVGIEDLVSFLRRVENFETIDLSLCGSLPLESRCKHSTRYNGKTKPRSCSLKKYSWCR